MIKPTKIYVKEILNPKQELDFYITQSWLNVVQPGGSIQSHWHGNSIISGSVYPAVEKTDEIYFHDPTDKQKKCMIYFNLQILIIMLNLI